MPPKKLDHVLVGKPVAHAIAEIYSRTLLSGKAGTADSATIERRKDDPDAAPPYTRWGVRSGYTATHLVVTTDRTRTHWQVALPPRRLPRDRAHTFAQELQVRLPVRKLMRDSHFERALNDSAKLVTEEMMGHLLREIKSRPGGVHTRTVRRRK